MKNTILLSTLLASSLLLLNSCGKEGCTDSKAKNYCESCKKSDGSCTYEGEAVFWYNQSIANFLVNDGAVSLTYYVNGQIAGSSAANIYWTSAPNCGSAVTIERDLGKNKSQSYSYSIKDQTGWEYWNGNVTIKGGECVKIQLQ